LTDAQWRKMREVLRLCCENYRLVLLIRKIERHPDLRESDRIAIRRATETAVKVHANIFPLVQSFMKLAVKYTLFQQTVVEVIDAVEDRIFDAEVEIALRESEAGHA
jgi:hypothetical protein